MSHLLVMANETSQGEALLDPIRARAVERDARLALGADPVRAVEDALADYEPPIDEKQPVGAIV